MRIKPYDEIIDRSNLVDLMNQMNTHFDPENALFMTIEALDRNLSINDLTVISRDFLVVKDNQEKLIGQKVILIPLLQSSKIINYTKNKEERREQVLVMDEYYCRLCGTKHLQAIDDIICPTCESRYCILSIKNAIDEGRYNCSYCPEKLIETYGTTPVVTTEANALQALEKQIGKSIPKDTRITYDTFGFMAWRNRVIGLGIYKQELRVLPESLVNLRSLEKLNFRVNQLSSLPETLGDLTNLNSLDLSHNELSSLPETLGNLTNLNSLDLSSNRLSSLPETLGNLTNLQTIELERNKLSSLPETLGQLRNLQTLNLRDNKLTSLPETLGQLRNLQTLNLRDNKLTSLPEAIGNLTNLPWLDLSSNQLSSLPEAIGNLTNLQTLNLRDNKLTSLPVTIGNLKNLNSLNLSSNRLTFLPETLNRWLDALKKKGVWVFGRPLSSN